MKNCLSYCSDFRYDLSIPLIKLLNIHLLLVSDKIVTVHNEV